MTIMELGALGEFLGVFAIVATLIYLSIQIRHARHDSANAVLESRSTGLRELHMGVAASDGLLAAMTKAMDATDTTVLPFEAELISRGLDRQEAHRVWRYFFAQWRLLITQYEKISGLERPRGMDTGLRSTYGSGLGRLFWDSAPQNDHPVYAELVNRLIAEADQQ